MKNKERKINTYKFAYKMALKNKDEWSAGFWAGFMLKTEMED